MAKKGYIATHPKKGKKQMAVLDSKTGNLKFSDNTIIKKDKAKNVSKPIGY